MKLDQAQITILVGRESTTIELHDRKSNITFARVKLTPEQLSGALSRTARTECETEVFGLENVNKQMEMKDFTFEIPPELSSRSTEILKQIALRECPEGWVPDYYYGSKTSFFHKDGKKYARTTIRRWI